jgi:hypothetical protein
VLVPDLLAVGGRGLVGFVCGEGIVVRGEGEEKTPLLLGALGDVGAGE